MYFCNFWKFGHVHVAPAIIGRKEVHVYTCTHTVHCIINAGVTPSCNTLLKPKRHKLRCHDFLVHAYLLRTCTNVVDFRVMRTLMPSRMKFTKREPHSWDPRQQTTLTAYSPFRKSHIPFLQTWVGHVYLAAVIGSMWLLWDPPLALFLRKSPCVAVTGQIYTNNNK